MTKVFKGIDKEFMKMIVERMDDEGVDYMEIPFDEFKELIDSDTNAKSIKSISQSITIQMNKVGPSEWVYKAGNRDNGNILHISRTKKL